MVKTNGKKKGKYGLTPTGRLRKEPKVLINFKVSPDEKKALAAFARKYTGGKLSAWLRKTSLQPAAIRSMLRREASGT